MARYGEEFVRYRDAERLRRVQQKFAEARKVYLEIVEKWPETVYAEASRLYAAKCLVAMGKTDEAKRELHVFRQSDPYGLYRGEAAIEMGRIALEHDLVPQAARGAFLLAETWLREVQNQKPLNIDRLAVPEKARQVTAPPRRLRPPAARATRGPGRDSTRPFRGFRVAASCIPRCVRRQHVPRRVTRCRGAPGVTRTPGLRFRKPPLYPAELRAQGH